MLKNLLGISMRENCYFDTQDFYCTTRKYCDAPYDRFVMTRDEITNAKCGYVRKGCCYGP